MRKGVWLFCLFFYAFIKQANCINLTGFYVADVPLNLDTKNIILQSFSNKKEAEFYIYKKQNSLFKNLYLIEFQTYNNIEINTYNYTFGAQYNSIEILYATWEKQNNTKNTFIISFEAINNYNDENTFQRGIYTAKKINTNSIQLTLENLTETITYFHTIPFTTDLAPSLQNNSNIAPIVGNYIVSFALDNHIKLLNLYTINHENTTDIILKKLYKEALQKNKKIQLYNITFFANNNIQVKNLNPLESSETFTINIGQWQYIDHENYNISLQISNKNSPNFYEYKGDFKLNKNSDYIATLNLKKQYPIKSQHRLLYYYNNYLNRLKNTYTSVNKNHKIIGYYTHHNELNFCNNYLPIELEQHTEYEFAKLFLEDFYKTYGQIFYFKNDNTLEIIDFFNNNPYPLPIEAFWYPSMDNNTYIIKYRLENNDIWNLSLYTLKKEDISSFILEKWTHIACHNIINK